MSKDELLLAWTGKDSRIWIKRVQRLIEKTCFDANPGEIHPACEPLDWLVPLSTELSRRIAEQPGNSGYDENIAMAGSLATILAVWSVRIGRAKAHDPNRPVKSRRKALGHSRLLALAVFDAVHDETQDAKYFPGQSWDYPMAKDARGGEFV